MVHLEGASHKDVFRKTKTVCSHTTKDKKNNDTAKNTNSRRGFFQKKLPPHR